MANKITVLLADDHALVRRGFRRLLEDDPAIAVVGEASDGDEAVTLAASLNPQVIVMDCAMPGTSGLVATKQILQRAPETAVLMLSMHSEGTLVRQAMDSGARGYILKETPHETLLRAIEKVAAGETFVDPALIPSLATGRDGQEILTAREREILQLLADGMSNADVAQQLFISQETVKSHVRHILAKLEAETRTQAVAIALREAMID